MSGWKRYRGWFVLGLTGAILANWHLAQARIGSVPSTDVIGANQSAGSGNLHDLENTPTSEFSSGQNGLSAALANLEKGDYDTAYLCLSGYVETHPNHLRARTFLADLLVQRGLYGEASREYAACIRLLQERNQLPFEQIFCHQRITEIADVFGDDYTAHLHRGIGLYLRARHNKGTNGESRESLLCQSADELVRARILMPGTARPCYYLHLVWTRLGQKQLADRSLADARRNAPFDALTPMEQQELMLATPFQPWR